MDSKLGNVVSCDPCMCHYHRNVEGNLKALFETQKSVSIIWGLGLDSQTQVMNAKNWGWNPIVRFAFQNKAACSVLLCQRKRGLIQFLALVFLRALLNHDSISSLCGGLQILRQQRKSSCFFRLYPLTHPVTGSQSAKKGKAVCEQQRHWCSLVPL